MGVPFYILHGKSGSDRSTEFELGIIGFCAGARGWGVLLTMLRLIISCMNLERLQILAFCSMNLFALE